jgi:hypothetical protein
LARELPLAVRPTRRGEAVLDCDLLSLAAELEREARASESGGG